MTCCDLFLDASCMKVTFVINPPKTITIISNQTLEVEQLDIFNFHETKQNERVSKQSPDNNNHNTRNLSDNNRLVMMRDEVTCHNDI